MDAHRLTPLPNGDGVSAARAICKVAAAKGGAEYLVQRLQRRDDAWLRTLRRPGHRQPLELGADLEQLTRILEPLFSTKARGLGLGLAIARSILEKNNGTMWLSSEPGRGATFTVSLGAW